MNGCRSPVIHSHIVDNRSHDSKRSSNGQLPAACKVLRGATVTLLDLSGEEIVPAVAGLQSLSRKGLGVDSLPPRTIDTVTSPVHPDFTRRGLPGIVSTLDVIGYRPAAMASL